MAIVIVGAGVVAMLVALLSSSGSPTSDNPRQSGNRSKAIEPVAPIDPEDIDQVPAAKDKPVDPADPFAISFGKSARRDVTVRVTSNGLVNMSESYRNEKKPSKRVVNGSYTETRTFKSRYPMASVILQIPGSPKTSVRLPGTASRATCTITIDGVEVAKQTTTKPGGLVFCIG
ncbi:MAG: hypothetical protein ACRDOT_06355 [Aeromicrobium sp.]